MSQHRRVTEEPGEQSLTFHGTESEWERRAVQAEADRDRLREALELCDDEDMRINGCACKPGESCYLHGVIVAGVLAGGKQT